MGRWARSAAPEGPISLGYRLGHLKGDPQVYRAVVYDKGAYVLHMLRGLVGDASFDGALRSLQTTRRFTKIGSEDLRQALETASGRDLGPYFRHWVDGTDLPVLRVSHQSEAAADVGHRTWIEIRPQNLPGPFPVQLTVFSAAGRETRRVTLDPSGGRFEIDTRQAPTRVQVNDDLALLAEVVQG